ncbi:MAG TPA: carbamoyltransferase HypF [Jatrophihabitans sp.]|nr:carbamoyltransferase HypF [Jatrophihabitans sp.]
MTDNLAVRQVLIAGIGNIFLGDDGFGPEVARRLPSRPGVRIVDYGIRGMHLAYDLLAGYRALVILDLLPHGAPGRVRTLAVGPADLAGGSFDAHGMDPATVLATLRTLGGTLPPTYVVGCAPVSVEEGIGLTPSLAAAVDDAVAAVLALLGGPLADRQRRTFLVRGVVQGVGFRPYVYALARQLGLAGTVANTADGVRVEVEGEPAAVAAFGSRLPAEAPPLAAISTVDEQPVPVRGGTDFTIEASVAGPGRTFVSPDLATCAACLAELADPADRRYRHPFISCTNCGPRFTIVTGLPYDRPATTMAGFPLCPDCAAEYADPADRRFHAQPVACPACGPTLRLDDTATGEQALRLARELLAAGGVLAIKGLGGYHLACDATNEAAVAALRKRKDRGDKPFAVLATDLAAARRLVEVDRDAATLLTGPQRPIVLLPRRPDAEAAAAVAPGNPDLGVQLPSTPVHHLLLADRPLVLTSGNLAGEPIVTDDQQARVRLAGLADAWLWHDRPIQVPCDDSVIRLVDGAELPVRRSRGYAPLPVALPVEVPPTLATGGDLKNAFCLAEGGYAWLSAHVGDLDDLATWQALTGAEAHLEALTGVRPELLATDLHPGYRSARWAAEHAAGRPVHRVQHHHAHLAACLADNGIGDERVIGFAFDGTGYGSDGAVWGGEVLVAGYRGFDRVAHLPYVPLPGGDAGVRNPCRMALSHLRAAGLAWSPELPAVAACAERDRLAVQLDRRLNCLPTSSMGRLFDAVAALAGVCQRSGYEAQAAMELEGLARGRVAGAGPGYRFGDGFDPAPVLAAVVADVLAGADPGLVGARFHLAVAAAVAELAERARTSTGLSRVALSGGVFLNGLLLSLCRHALEARDFEVLRHRQVPPSDAGLALGQVLVAAHRRRGGRACA